MIPRSWRHLRAAALLLLPALAGAATLQTFDPLDEPPENPRRLVELHPTLGASGSYDSNIFLHKAASPSWIATQNAGLHVPMASPSEHHHLELDYDGAHRDYYNANAPTNVFIHNLAARYWLKTPAGFTVRARDLYLNTVDPATSEQSDLQHRWENTAGLDLGYEPEERPWNLRVGADQSRYKWVHGIPTLDRYEQRFGARVGWQAQPKTVAYAAYHRQLIHYTDHPDPSRDSQGDLVDFGVEGRLLPKTTGRAQVGLVDRRYDAAASPGQDRQTTNFTALVSVDYAPDDRSKAQIRASRTLEESEFDVNQFYIANTLALDYTHQLPWQLTGNFYAATEWDKYPTTTVGAGAQPVNQLTHVYRGGATLEYPLRDWLRAFSSFEYRSRFARALTEQFDYTDEITTVGLTATF